MAGYNFSDLVKEVKAGTGSSASKKTDVFSEMVQEVKRAAEPWRDTLSTSPAGVSGPIAQPKALQEYHKAYGQAVKAAQADASTFLDIHTPSNSILDRSLKKSVAYAKPTKTPETKVDTQTLEKMNAEHFARATKNGWALTSEPTAKDNLKSLGGELITGLNNVSTALYKTADFFIPDEGISQIFGVENKVGNFFDWVYANNEEFNRQQEERRANADKWAANVGRFVVQPAVQAVPNMALAYLTKGGSLMGQGATALGTAANTASTASMVGNAAKDILSNPSFWMSFAQTAGPTYFDAKEQGANDMEAGATALLNAFAGSAIEVGGGIETLPSTSMGVRQWVRSMLDEGKEEVLQGTMEGLVSNAVYDKDREWFSLTDPDAIFSGSRALQEFAGGVTVGGILGGGQIGISQAVNALNQYSAAVKVGNTYLRGENGTSIEGALKIGFSNAKGTDTYRAAEVIQQQVANGEKVTPYAVGRMVIQSFTTEARKARTLDAQVRQSAQTFGIDEQTVDDIARIAVATGRQVEFVAPEQLQVVGVNGVSTAEGRYVNGKVQLNAAMPADRLTGYLIKHELTHSIQGTKQWAQLEQIVRSSYGDAAFEAAVNEVTTRYAANNTRLTPEGAAREVVAQWVGNNLFKEGFAQAIANGDATVGTAFVQMLDKIRLALGGTKNSRTAGNIALVERLFMRALENVQGRTKNTATDEQYVIGYTDNNQPVVIISENILNGVPQDQWINTVKETIKKRFSSGVPVGGRLVKVNKLTRDEYTWSRNSQSYSKNDPAVYEDKLKAGGSLDEIVLASTNYVNEDLNHSRKDNFTQFARGDVLMRIGKNDYTAKVIIGWTSGNQMVLYDVIDFLPTTLNIKKAGVSSPSSFTQVEQNSSNTSASNTRVSQNSFGVNSYSMQNGGENSQFSFGGVNGTDINVPYEGELTTPPPSDDGTSPDKGRPGDAQTRGVEVAAPYDEGTVKTANRQAFANLDEAAEVVDLSDDNELSRRLEGLHGAEKYKEIQQYILEALGDQPIMLSDGKQAVVDNRDASHIARGAGDKKTAQIAAIKNVVESAVLVAEESSTKDGKFDYFYYYEARVRFGEKTYPIYLNVGRSRNDATFHIYDITQKLRDTAHRLNDVGRPVGYAMEAVSPNYSIRNSEENVKGNSSTGFAEVEVQGQEIPEGTVGATETVYREERITPDAVRREAAARAGTAVQEKTVAQGKTLEELEQELSDRELFNRMYMAEQIDRPDSTVEIDGKQISSDAYMDAVEDMLPDTVEGVEQYIQEISGQQGEEMARAFDETGEVGETTLPVELEMLAAQRKVERMRLAAGETDGKVWRRFYEQRLKGLDANQTHAAEAVEYLAGRDERYSPISNAKTLEKAQMRLKDPAYVERLGRRIKRYKPGDMFNDVDAAAAQVMINDAKNNGDLELYSDLVVGLSRKGTEFGRAVQILSMQAKLTPEGTIRAAQRTMQKAVDGQYGEGTSDSIDQVSGTIVDAVERAAVNLEGATVGELETALGDAITAQNSPYITEKQIRDIVHAAVDKATNVPQQLKRMLQKDDVQKTLAEKILYIHSQGHLTDARMSGVVKEALGLPDITTEDMGQLIALVETMQETEEGTLERQAATEEIYRFLGEKLPVTKLEALMGWRKFAMLANPKTHFRNIVSNLVMQKGINKVDAAISTVLQKWIIADPSQRTAFVGWRGTDFGKQLMADGALEKSAERALVRLRGSEKYEMTNSKLAQYKKEFEALFGKKLGAALDKLSGWNSNKLEAEDAWAFKPAFIDALGQIMTVRKTTEITEEIFEIAYDKAAETVFRAENAMATVLSQMKQGMFDMSTAKGKKALAFIADIVIPFSKTPANIAVSSFQHSPLGLVKSSYDLVQMIRGKNSKQTADIINSFSKNITGTLLMGIGLLLGSLGLFNTGYGKTEKERAADELAGIQQNALVIGNVSFTLDWLQPSASPLIVGASIAQRLREDGLSLSAIGGAVMDGTDSLFELTMLQSLYDVLGGYDAGASASAASIAENVVSQSIPTLLGQAARAIDPVQRKTRGDNDFETIVNQIMAKVPGLTYLLEPELDVWGNEVYRTGKASAGNAFLNAVQQFILPFNYKQGTGADDHLSWAVLELYNSGADKSSRALPTSVTRDDAREMGVDYDELFRIVAQMQREKVEELMNDKVSYSVQTAGANGKKRTVQKRWSQMTEDEQLRVMNRVYSDVKSTATDPDEAFYDEIIGRLRYGS